MTHSLLGLIAVTGKDAKTFLQGQITCDINEVSHTHYQLGACCNKKGRVIATFRCFQAESAYYLLLPLVSVTHTINHLKRYLVFSKTHIDDATSHLSKLATLDEQITHDTWKQHDIESGIPNIYPETAGLFTPQMINYDHLGGVSFKKGCYLGQEIVARTAYLGKVKKHLYTLTVHDSHIKPQAGNKLYDSTNAEIGTIIDAFNKNNQSWKVLAVILDTAFQKGDLVLA